ncbi:MAG: pilus assembly protein PilP, partial [Dongiaceae bacterium]
MSTGRLLLIGLAVLAAGCAQDMSDLEEYEMEVKSRTSKIIEPIPQPKPYEPFVYEPGERRDPFLPILQSREAAIAGAGGA